MRSHNSLFGVALLQIEIRTLGDVKLLKLNGRLTLGEAADRLRDTLDDLMGSGACCLVLDLSEVAMLDSSGIGVLVRYLKSAKQQGGSLKLLNPTSFAVRTLRMIGLLNLFEVFQDQAAAVASFQPNA